VGSSLGVIPSRRVGKDFEPIVLNVTAGLSGHTWNGRRYWNTEEAILYVGHWNYHVDLIETGHNEPCETHWRCYTPHRDLQGLHHRQWRTQQLSAERRLRRGAERGERCASLARQHSSRRQAVGRNRGDKIPIDAPGQAELWRGQENAGAALESMADAAVLVNSLLVVRISTDLAVRSGGVRKLTRLGLI